MRHRAITRLVRTPDGCLEGQGKPTRGGYLRGADREGNVKLLHRVAYEEAFGPIPVGFCVCHRCDNRRCCEPAHLFLGTDADNNADMVAKGRASRGENRGAAKLDPAKVREIRRLLEAGMAKRQIAFRFGVTDIAILKIARRQTWTHVS